MIKEIRYWLATVFIKWIMVICPDCRFKDALYIFLKDNIKYLMDDISDEFIKPKNK